MLAAFAAVAVLLAGCASGAPSGHSARPSASTTPKLTDAALSAVSAVSPSLAWAVGSDSSGALIIRWNGTAWDAAPVPRTGAGSTLTSVTAVSARDAWASGTDGVGKPMILHWNGSAWIRSSGPGLSSGKRLFSIAAAAPDTALAVGGFPGGYCGYGAAFIAKWTGSSWKRQVSPNAGPLSAVTVGPADRTWAVGGCLSTVIFRREKSGWARVPSPSPADGDDAVNLLNGVVAISASDAWAVGAIAGVRTSPLILHWDGVRWNLVPSPAARDGQLHAVAATSATSAWAVGLAFGRKTTVSLLLRWNGVRWTREHCPGTKLTGLTAAGAGSAWAVGATKSGPLILHWTGSRWEQQPI